MPKNITALPDYRKPTERESVLDAALLDSEWELRPEISFYSSKAVFLTQEWMRERVIWLIKKNCPNGDQFLGHIEIKVRKKRKKAPALTVAA